MTVVTAPTSNIGRQVQGNILDSGESVRVIARSSRLPEQTRERVEIVEASHSKLDVVTKAFRSRLTGNGMSEAMAQSMVNMMVAKSEGMDNAEPRTPQSTSPTSFRQWCEEFLKPAIESI
jgi:hypothetical protein